MKKISWLCRGGDGNVALPESDHDDRAMGARRHLTWDGASSEPHDKDVTRWGNSNNILL